MRVEVILRRVARTKILSHFVVRREVVVVGELCRLFWMDLAWIVLPEILSASHMVVSHVFCYIERINLTRKLEFLSLPTTEECFSLRSGVV